MRTGFNYICRVEWQQSVLGLRRVKWLACLAFTASLAGCSLFTEVPPEISYSKAVSPDLYRLESWSLDGRVALTGMQDSWSADLAWSHQGGDDQINLSGPLGQGAVKIHLLGDKVTVAEGDDKVESSDDPEGFINQRLGVFVPVTSLRYWVLGVPEPELHFEEINKGFRQSGWTVAFQAMQQVGDWFLPRKMSVTNERVKLKLIINQWMLNDGKKR